jgi:hypothetical protein
VFISFSIGVPVFISPCQQESLYSSLPISRCPYVYLFLSAGLFVFISTYQQESLCSSPCRIGVPVFISSCWQVSLLSRLSISRCSCFHLSLSVGVPVLLLTVSMCPCVHLFISFLSAGVPVLFDLSPSCQQVSLCSSLPVSRCPCVHLISQLPGSRRVRPTVQF